MLLVCSRYKQRDMWYNTSQSYTSRVRLRKTPSQMTRSHVTTAASTSMTHVKICHHIIGVCEASSRWFPYTLLHLQDGPKNQLDEGADNSTDFPVKKKQLPIYFRPFIGAPELHLNLVRASPWRNANKKHPSIIISAKMGLSPIVGTLSFKANFPLNHD